MLALDSNTISYYFRGDPRVVARLQALRPADLGVPAIVEYELRHGLRRLPPEAAQPRLTALVQMLRPLQVLPFDSECATHAARIRVQLEAAGTPIGPNDTLIAATALRYRATLVTRNAREFSRVAGLQWVNWHAADESATPTPPPPP
ncbi:type II toxin-antitoxin system VapC family toxin [Ottowia sp.]|jgi:tRNA(fMet)-specific endonuclease VapC|uniref:type II toxin-antitoxin system VapC family toxin n=1 Tax=Ottowia sp. TaxID=1898956 RepID=UPI0025E75C0B|nr:type II toxin-antitoxin system VapC family toxin [Ottowia sp.]MBK6614004.1 type II toxin-antitoxin system VapC family toxin [Ottowia sp.]MBK6745437.1 type II toxin-antitoxin system VapC family toxin [Ottowia sp.]